MRCDCGNTVVEPGYAEVTPPVIRDRDYVPVLGEDFDIGCNPFTYHDRVVCLHCSRTVKKPESNDNKQQVE